ncbi:MAG: M20/M25/M40 family metallo-hydrolase, partial [Armatimonadetes bacterium]|nr:M20/M25/M40 family metallo-hydrolase [Armatimonadota bacterium]
GLEAEYRQIPEDIVDDPEYTFSDNQQPYAGRFNVVGQVGSDRGRSVILQSHSDVVPATAWEDAFKPHCDGEFVIGRGATDAKGQIVTQWLAIGALRQLGLKPAGRVEVQTVIEEEVGGNGALALIRQGCSADGVVVMEASSLNVFPANRGAIWFRARTTGRSVHMGRRHEGVNAIEKMVIVILQMLEYEKRLIEESRGHPLFLRYENPVQLCLGTIRADGWPSMVAGECVLEGGVGFLPNKSMQQVKQELWDAVMAADDEWLRDHFELTFPKLHNDAYEIDPGHPLVTTLHRAVLECGYPSEVFGWNVSCDARLYAKVAGLPTVVYGPSDIVQAHSDGERIRVDEMLNAAVGLAKFILEWCGWESD